MKLDVGNLLMANDACGNEGAACIGTIVRITDPNEVESQWRKLELSCNPSFFLTWSWIGPWANLIKKNTELFLFTAKVNNSNIAMCFLAITHVKRLQGLIKVKRVMLNDFMNQNCNMIIQYNGMLVKDEFVKQVWSSFCKCLISWNKSWDEFAISSITQSQLNNISNGFPRLEMAIDRVHREWVVPLSPEYGDPVTLIDQFKSKSRRQLRQSLKAIEKEVGPVSVSVAANIEDALKYFDNMGKLHTERWEKAGIAGSFANQNWVNFHKEIIRNEFPNGNILLFAIKSGGIDIGYLYGHVYNNTAYMQQTGFASMKQNILKPGYVSHLYAMAFCAANGIKEYNFLPDEENSYKKFFTPPGNPILWVSFRKNSKKLKIEKYIRLLHGYLRKIMGG